jgi:hypothetical protein
LYGIEYLEYLCEVETKFKKFTDKMSGFGKHILVSLSRRKAEVITFRAIFSKALYTHKKISQKIVVM